MKWILFEGDASVRACVCLFCGQITVICNIFVGLPLDGACRCVGRDNTNWLRWGEPGYDLVLFYCLRRRESDSVSHTLMPVLIYWRLYQIPNF